MRWKPTRRYLHCREHRCHGFQAVKNQHRTFKAGNPAGDAVQVDLFPRGGNKISVGFQAKHTDQLWAEHRAMLDAHRIHDAAVRIHTDKKIPFADKISQCVCHTRTPSMLSIAKPTCGMRRFPALCRQLLSYQKAANFCKCFCKVLHFYDNFLSATNCPSFPLGLTQCLADGLVYQQGCHTVRRGGLLVDDHQVIPRK